MGHEKTQQVVMGTLQGVSRPAWLACTVEADVDARFCAFTNAGHAFATAAVFVALTPVLARLAVCSSSQAACRAGLMLIGPSDTVLRAAAAVTGPYSAGLAGGFIHQPGGAFRSWVTCRKSHTCESGGI